MPETAALAAAALRSRLDLLINNAGVMYTPKQTTRDGVEMQFGTKGHPRLVTSNPESYEATVQQRLWAVSEDLTGVRSPIAESQRSPFPSGSAITM